jgi:hypothetical protein
MLRNAIRTGWVYFAACVLGFALAPAAAAATASTATLAFVGDICFRDSEEDPDPFADVRERLARADYTVGNLEGILLKKPTEPYEDPRINITVHARNARKLKESGIDLFGLANNHSWDHGSAGLLETKKHVERLGLPTYGAARKEEDARAARRIDLPVGCVSVVPATVKSNKKPEPGAFAATYDIKDPSPLAARLKAEREAGCFVVLSVHGGKERAPMPTDEVMAAYRAMALEADLVVGHHPHVLEGVEFSTGGAIAYSLGNFVFKNTPEYDHVDKRRSGILEAVLEKGPGDARARLKELAVVPVTLDPQTFRPRVSKEGPERDDVVQVLTERSAPFGTKARLDGDRLVFER